VGRIETPVGDWGKEEQMIRIEPIPPTADIVEFGSAARYKIRRTGEQNVQTRAFLKHGSVFYLKPLCDWG